MAGMGSEGQACKLSPLSCILVLLGTGIGTGLLVLPYTANLVGWLPLGLLLFLAAIINTATTTMLFCATAHLADEKSKALLPDKPRELPISAPMQTAITYSNLLFASTGRQWVSQVVDGIIALDSFLCVVNNYLFLASFLTALPIWKLSTTATKVLIACAQAPAMLADNSGALSSCGSVSLLTLLVFAFVVLVETPEYMEARTAPLVPVGELSTMPDGLCICIFAFFWHTNAVAVARDFERPTPMRCLCVSAAASFVLALAYGLIGLGGYFSFGSTARENIANNYPHEEALFVCLRLAFALSLSISCVLQLMPMRESLILLVREAVPEFGSRRSSSRLLGVVIVAMVLAASILAPSVVDLIRFIGGLLDTLLAILFPTIIWGRLLHKNRFGLIMAATMPLALLLSLAGCGLI
eukprot:gnl/TRDRNA2_/TRDRNA2_202839_c0_seq1.p1 gnl/TRDRNA2_/TRDRNA2_202839_c0~~gnl/TRDRNA2_/TRDRNA2_202839_c0_seq1.p1  ORF type:complete len:412 (-),score=55.88 gnl/TRDRNA2_/TRDRNA2_202839_c0_seq1:127-1362(-)